MNAIESPNPPKVVSRLATIGRLGLSLSGLVALLAVFVDFRDGNILSLLLAVVGCLGLIACALMGIFKPMRVFDLATVILAAMLAGSFVVWGFGLEYIGGNAVSLLAWVLMLSFGGLVAVGLAFGPAIKDAGFDEQVEGLFRSSGGTPNGSSGYPAPAQPAPAQPAPAQSATYSPPTQQPAQSAAAPVAEDETDEAEHGDEIPAGWYPQEDGINARYWTGTEWSDDIRPISEIS